MKKSLGAKTFLEIAPVWVIGTYDNEGKPNIMPASWAGICCSSPPCVSVALREATYTYKNIIDKKAFTVNVPSVEQIKIVDFLGVVSGRDVDKFKEAPLTPVKSSLVDAPYVEEFPVNAECKLINSIKLGLHTLFIGEILDVKADIDVLADESIPKVEKIKPFLFSPVTYQYYKVGENIGKAFSLGKRE